MDALATRAVLHTALLVVFVAHVLLLYPCPHPPIFDIDKIRNVHRRRSRLKTTPFRLPTVRGRGVQRRRLPMHRLLRPIRIQFIIVFASNILSANKLENPTGRGGGSPLPLLTFLSSSPPTASDASSSSSSSFCQNWRRNYDFTKVEKKWSHT